MDNEPLTESDDLHPGDFEPGSIESRAAARAVLDAPGRPPIIISEYTEPGPRDEQGRMNGSPVVCESRTADVNGVILTRAENETMEQFTERCCASVPAMRTGIITMRGDG